MNKTIRFDPFDFGSILKIMDEHGNANGLMPGENENGEEIYMSPHTDRLVIKTFQKNGWTRINTYWRDGTCEETFEGRWDREKLPDRCPHCGKKLN